MRLLRLEILNLASLDKAGGEIIDFENGALGESNIFSIVGPTGSGKSTILDAICLALYNRAPRYPKEKGDRKQKIEIFGDKDADEKARLAPTDCRNILTRGKKDGYSKLTFRMNDGNVYRAEWSVHIKSKLYDNPETSLFKISVENGQRIETSMSWSDLPQIIGLEYDQFLRTVLIAQGSFANFLNSSEEDRYVLLEKLIGNGETYARIASMIIDRKRLAVEEFNRMDANLSAIRQNLLSPEDLEKLNGQIAELESEEKTVNGVLEQIAKDLQWYSDDDKQILEIKTREEDASVTRQRLEAFHDSEKRLNLHDSVAEAVDMLRDLEKLESSMAARGKELESTKRKVLAVEEEVKNEKDKLPGFEAEETKADEAVKTAAPHISKARELWTLKQVAQKAWEEKGKAKNAAETAFATAKKNLEDNTKDIASTKAKLEQSLQERDRLEKNVKEKKSALQAASTKAEEDWNAESQKIADLDAETLHNRKNAADATHESLKIAIQVTGTLEDLSKERSSKQSTMASLENEKQVIEKELAGIKAKTDVLESEVDTLRRTYTLMTSEEWGKHRGDLKDGTPCPLCGSVHHPYEGENDLYRQAQDDMGILLTQKTGELESLRMSQNAKSARNAQIQGELSTHSQQLGKIQRDIEANETRWHSLQEKHPSWPQAKSALESILPETEAACHNAEEALRGFLNVQQNVTKLEREKSSALKCLTAYERSSNEQMRTVEGKVTEGKASLEMLQAQTGSLENQLQERKNDLEKAVAESNKAHEEFKSLCESYDRELGGKNPDEVEKRLAEAKDKASRNVQDQKERIQKLDGDAGTLRGSLEILSSQQERERKDLDSGNVRLDAWTACYNEKEDRICEINRQDIKDMLHASDDWMSVRARVGILKSDVQSKEALLLQSRKDHEAHQKDKPENGKDELSDGQELQTQKRQELNDQMVSFRAKKKSHEDAMRKLGDQEEAYLCARDLKDDWSAIADAVGSDGKTFRKIAQCYTLRFLVEHANEEIRRFNSRYELMQVKNSLGLRVIDHDRADDVREISSLSGGETFIVSLGLALGLSSLSSRNLSFENLFIDEGFGTLDRETLGVVIDSLAMLQNAQGKKVGIISHTDTMSERITTQIRVVKNGSTGSSHIEIYPQ